MLGWQRAVEAAPDSPEAHYETADRFYHTGALVGISGTDDRPFAHFSRALALDSAHVGAIAHLIEIAARRGDAQTSRALLARYLKLAANADARPFVEWRTSVAGGRPGPMLATEAARSAIPQFSLNRIIGFGLLEADAVADVDRATVELRRRLDGGTLPPPRIHPAQTLHSWAQNRGRREAARHAIDALRRVEPFPHGASTVYYRADHAVVLDALFWDGDTTGAMAAAARLSEQVAAAPPHDPGERAEYFGDACITLLWRFRDSAAIARTESADTRRIESHLRSGLGANEPAGLYGNGSRLCTLMIDAMRAAASPGPRDAANAITRLDSALVAGPFAFGIDFGNIVLARVQRRVGDFSAAHRTIRRRPYDWDTGPLYLTTLLREQGRMAALDGDREEAIGAFQRYLRLRDGADESFRAVDDSVRAELAALRR